MHIISILFKLVIKETKVATCLKHSIVNIKINTVCENNSFQTTGRTKYINVHCVVDRKDDAYRGVLVGDLIYLVSENIHNFYYK